jgi:thioredoxin reductase (NADPH)
MSNEHHKLIILGSGPAGLTAALYSARANLAPLVVEGTQPGGQLTITTEVENFPGYPEGVMGPEMMVQFREQAARFGTQFAVGDVESVDLSKRPFTLKTADKTFTCDTLIISTGATARLLGLPSETTLMGHGVSACATCDGFFFRGKKVLVVGGGDSAMEEASFLTKFASSVTIIHRREEFRASKIMLDRARGIENIEWMTPYVPEEFVAGEDGSLDHARLKHATSGETVDVPISGVFIAIGHEPQSQLVEGLIDTDDEGYVITEGRSTRTKRPGVFAAGDLVDHTYRQAVTAAGSGTQAALDAEWYLRDTPGIEPPEGMPEGDLAEAQWAPPRSA